MNFWGEGSGFRFSFPDRIAHSTVKSSELTKREIRSGQGVGDTVIGGEGSLRTLPQKTTSERSWPPLRPNRHRLCRKELERRGTAGIGKRYERVRNICCILPLSLYQKKQLRMSLPHVQTCLWTRFLQPFTALWDAMIKPREKEHQFLLLPS